MFIMTHICTSTAFEYCISAQDLSNSAQIYGKSLVSGFAARGRLIPLELGVRLKCRSDEELQV